MSGIDEELDEGTSDNTTATPTTTHSVGELAPEVPPTMSQTDVRSSNDSASSPSEDETTAKTKHTYSGSASSPSSSETTTTSQRTHSVQRSPTAEEGAPPAPKPKQRPQRQGSLPARAIGFAYGDTPQVSPNYVKPYSTRHDAELEARTAVRTLHDLREEANERYKASFEEYRKTHTAWPPVAFSEEWFTDEYSLPYARWYQELVPIVMARQAEDARAQQAVEQPTASSTAVTASTSEPSLDLLYERALNFEDELELDTEPSKTPPRLTQAQVDQVMAEVQPYHDAPPAQSVPSIKPAGAKTHPPKTTHSVDKSRPVRPRTAYSADPAVHDSSKKKESKKHKEHKKDAEKDPKKKASKTTVAALKRREAAPSTSQSDTSRSSSKRSRDPSSSSRPPASKTAKEDTRPPSRSRSLSPNMARHQKRVNTTRRRTLVPVMDGYVDKAWAVRVFIAGHKGHSWPTYFLDSKNKYELLGLINRIGVPASYLQVGQFKLTAAGPRTPLANITYDQLFIEDTIIPKAYIIGTTLGALPAYWRQCVATTALHLADEVEKSAHREQYRDLRRICGIGPTGFDLRGSPLADTREYERFANAARDTNYGLTVVMFYDEDPAHVDNIHADAIRTLQDAGLPPRQRIHLIVGRASALELVLWLEAFPRTLFSFDLYFIGGVRNRLGKSSANPLDPRYIKADAMQVFLTYMPLDHLSLHSGCAEPIGPIEDKKHRSPLDIIAAAGEFEAVTMTDSETVHANNARNLVTFYRLDFELLSCSVSHREYRPTAKGGPRLPLRDFINHIRAAYGAAAAPRAAEQEMRDEPPPFDAAPAEVMDLKAALTA